MNPAKIIAARCINGRSRINRCIARFELSRVRELSCYVFIGEGKTTIDRVRGDNAITLETLAR